MNSFLLVCDVFSFVFWANPRPEKNRFEIIWPLEIKKFLGSIQLNTHLEKKFYPVYTIVRVLLCANQLFWPWHLYIVPLILCASNRTRPGIMSNSICLSCSNVHMYFTFMYLCTAYLISTILFRFAHLAQNR